MIREWIHKIIDDCGGLHDFEDREIATPIIPRDEIVAAWVIMCLSNPKCEGSQDVIDQIIDRRIELKQREVES